MHLKFLLFSYVFIRISGLYLLYLSYPINDSIKNKYQTKTANTADIDESYLVHNNRTWILTDLLTYK